MLWAFIFDALYYFVANDLTRSDVCARNNETVIQAGNGHLMRSANPPAFRPLSYSSRCRFRIVSER
jgi:hypothetical protein